MALDKIFGNGDLDKVADSVFSAVSNSTSEIKVMQKRKAAENVQIVVQALKKIEADLRGEYDDVADKLAERIASIKNGKDGQNGVNGKDGKDGRPGRDGATGARGNDGLPGRNGVDGVNGVSVVNAYIDFDGSLIIDLSNGQALNVGEVVSQDLAERIKIISTMSTSGGEGGSGTVTSVAATAGTGISLTGSPITTSGTLNITNTAPDQIVALTGAGDTTVTGTYPNFTISSSGGGSGTVTSVSGTGTVSGISLSGTVTSSGNLTLGGSLDLSSVTGTLPVGNGGTGLATLTANNVVIGNGTSAPLFVAPGTSGNVLTSNGTTWESTAGATSDVTLAGTQTLTNKTIDANLNTLLNLPDPAEIRAPAITSPADGATGVVPQPTIEGSAYAPLYSADPRDFRQLQIDLASGNFSSPVVDQQANTDNITVDTPLAINTEHKARIRDVSTTGVESEFSAVVAFTIVNIIINEPTLTVEGSPSDVPEAPTLTTSAFATTPTNEDTHLNTDWQVLENGTVVFESLADATNKLSIVVPAGILEVDTTYTFRARHRGTTFGASAFGTVIATTLAQFEPQPGEAFGGGFLAGKLWSGSELQAVVIAPLASGESSTTLQYKTVNTSSPAATRTLNNGPAATAAMVSAGSHPAAAYCAALSIGGFSDWYLPARDELELCYRNLKPTTTANNTNDRPLSSITYPEGNDVSSDTTGRNRNSDPAGAAYTSGNPAQTTVTAFITGNTEAFAAASYWSSSEFSAALAWAQSFGSGFQGGFNKDSIRRVRAVRRVRLSPAIGEFFEGGFYAGAIVEGGVQYYVIVAPKATGESTSLQYKTSQTASPAATQTLNNGPAATAAMVAAGDHPAAAFCDGLTINGFSDWYLPARDELELCYRNLKPTTAANNTGTRALSTITYPEGNDESGDIRGRNRNTPSTFMGYNSANAPVRTNIALFQDSGTEAFAAFSYWSSSEFSASVAWVQSFSSGLQDISSKSSPPLRVRAVRRLPV